MKTDIKIPTIVAILIIVVTLGGITTFTNYFLKGNSLAQANPLPQRVVVTSVTDSSFVVTWETQKPVLSAIIVTDPKGEKRTFFDQRHTVADTTKYTTASIPVRGLLPDTTYQIELLVNGKSYSHPEITTVHTGPKLSTDTNGIAPMYGSVLNTQQSSADGALVFLSYGENSQLLSSIVKPSGSWIIPLNLLRTEDLSELVSKTDERIQVSITIRLQGQETTILTDTLNASPVPTVTLGNTYDFRGLQGRKKTTPTDQQLSTTFSSVLGDSSPQAEHVVELITPPNNAFIPGDPPLVSGKGIPGNIVTLILGITHPKAETTYVSPDGTWRLSPKKSLGIGKQRVTMTTIDAEKKPVAITHLFEILKSGTQVLGNATPSATIAITPTASPSARPTITGTPTPSVIPSITLTPTQAVPTTATTTPTHLLILLGIGLILTGLVVIAI